MAPTISDSKKKKVDWSCKNCTKWTKRAQRCKGHLNYANRVFCRECGDHKSEVHLCAFSDFDRTLKSWNASGGWGQVISGATCKKGNTGNDKKDVGQSKREAELAKQVSDLQKQLGQSVTVEKPNEVADDKVKSAAQVASWKRVMNSMAASIKHAR